MIQKMNSKFRGGQFFGLLKVNFAGSKRKVLTISRQTHAKVSHQKLLADLFSALQNFLMKKIAKEKKWKLIVKVRRVQGVFFSEIREKCDNFCSTWNFSTDF
jgi:hypothetical protein